MFVITGVALIDTDEVVFVQPVAVSVKVNVTVPAATPVTTPALVTVATFVFELVHVPPVVGVKAPGVPIQTLAGAVTIGTGFTVNADVVLEHPVEVNVYVNVAVFCVATTVGVVMTPSFVICATAVLLLAQVPRVDGVAVVPVP
jgi:hypothetical protein